MAVEYVPIEEVKIPSDNSNEEKNQFSNLIKFLLLLLLGISVMQNCYLNTTDDKKNSDLNVNFNFNFNINENTNNDKLISTISELETINRKLKDTNKKLEDEINVLNEKNDKIRSILDFTPVESHSTTKSESTKSESTKSESTKSGHRTFGKSEFECILAVIIEPIIVVIIFSAPFLYYC